MRGPGRRMAQGGIDVGRVDLRAGRGVPYDRVVAVARSHHIPAIRRPAYLANQIIIEGGSGLPAGSVPNMRTGTALVGSRDNCSIWRPANILYIVGKPAMRGYGRPIACAPDLGHGRGN